MSQIVGPVRIVGAGLLGTSIGLALSKLGIDVIISSASEASISLAVEYGAGRREGASDNPEIIVVCVPPAITAEVVARELSTYPNAVVTDVASVKVEIFDRLAQLSLDSQRYVGSHPMAGRERGGAVSGRADLFVARPWVIVPHPDSTNEAVEKVSELAQALQAISSVMSPEAHDKAVAVVSHVPQVVASALASSLLSAESSELKLAGQGLRDTTRIAGSDPELWKQILTANKSQVSPIIRGIINELESFVDGLAANPEASIGELIANGNQGVQRIPGKHGGQASAFATVIVMVDDRPGELARLLTEIGQIGINLEDLKLEHSPGAQIGLAELYVLPEVEQKLISDLQALKWRIA